MERKISIGDKYGPVMEITDQSKADEYFEELVTHSMECFDNTREEAEKSERHNLSYYAGYYDNETRKRVEELFSCSHPVFGKASKNKALTPEEAFKAGQESVTRRN